jgi:hypothetical protein
VRPNARLPQRLGWSRVVVGGVGWSPVLANCRLQASAAESYGVRSRLLLCVSGRPIRAGYRVAWAVSQCGRILELGNAADSRMCDMQLDHLRRVTIVSS